MLLNVFIEKIFTNKKNINNTIKYYSSIENILRDKPCCKLYSFLCNGYFINHINIFINIKTIVIKQFNIKEPIGKIDYELTSKIDYELTSKIDNEFKKYMFIHNLFINEKYQKNGLGSHLLHLVEEKTKKYKINEIILYIHQNMRNLYFYNKNGYHINYYNNEYIRWKLNHNYIQMGKNIT